MVSITWTPVEDESRLKDSRLRLMLTHWSAAIRNGKPPTKEIVDPDKLGELMDWLFLYKVERRPLRFLYLQCGPGIVRRVGFDMTGRYLDEHPDPQIREVIFATLSAVATSRTPHYRTAPRRFLDHEVVTETLVLPLAGTDGSIDHLLALQVVGLPEG
ncbi:MAG: PAS domain-containing protein [Alphaproteobacteria bacterium]|nr:PAS domain-containing protein [Alphaproteobacteria bacterium]